VEGSARSFSPQVLSHYAFSLAQEFSKFYENVPVLSSEGEDRKARLALVRVVGIVLKNSLDLLAIPTPEKI